MANSARSNLIHARRSATRLAPGRKASSEAMDRELLGLWLEISRLREQVHGHERVTTARINPRQVRTPAPSTSSSRSVRARCRTVISSC